MLSPHLLEARASLQRAAALAGDDRLTAAVERLWAPPVVVLVGRVGVGKTTLWSRWTGVDAPTGLGGVTATPRAATADGATVIDTPGIDDPDRAIDRLGATLGDADAVVWVVDALQPLTASERAVMRALWPRPATVVVSRADVVASSEHDALLARVASLVPGSAARLWDLRRGPWPTLPPAPTPRQLAVAAEAVADAAASTRAAPEPPDRAEWQRRWRAEVREQADAVLAAIAAGTIAHKGRARAALRAGAASLRGRFPIPMPEPEALVDEPLRRLVDGLSGAEGAARLVKADAARWLAEGQLALADADLGAERRRRADQLDALDAAAAALDRLDAVARLAELHHTESGAALVHAASRATIPPTAPPDAPPREP